MLIMQNQNIYSNKLTFICLFKNFFYKFALYQYNIGYQEK